MAEFCGVVETLLVEKGDLSMEFVSFDLYELGR